MLLNQMKRECDVAHHYAEWYASFIYPSTDYNLYFLPNILDPPRSSAHDRIDILGVALDPFHSDYIIESLVDQIIGEYEVWLLWLSQAQFVRAETFLPQGWSLEDAFRLRKKSQLIYLA